MKSDGKVVAPGVVYVSTELNATISDHVAWFQLFLERLDLDTSTVPERFGGVLVTNRGQAGDFVPGVRNGMPGQEHIVAAVGILTDRYISASIDRKGGETTAGEERGELARLVAAALGERDAFPGTDPEVPLEMFLAPLDNVRWKAYKVAGVLLEDDRFTRLRETRFTWPGSNPALSKQEIDEASLRVVSGAARKE